MRASRHACVHLGCGACVHLGMRAEACMRASITRYCEGTNAAHQNELLMINLALLLLHRCRHLVQLRGKNCVSLLPCVFLFTSFRHLIDLLYFFPLTVSPQEMQHMSSGQAALLPFDPFQKQVGGARVTVMLHDYQVLTMSSCFKRCIVNTFTNIHVCLFAAKNELQRWVPEIIFW